jgi:hypothetical protein
VTDDIDQRQLERTEARLRGAVISRTTGVHPVDEAGSLAAIEERVGAVRRARRLRGSAIGVLGVAAAVALVAGMPALLRDGDHQQVQTTASDTTSTTLAPRTPTTAPTAETSAPGDAIWPPPSHRQYEDPVGAVRSFVEEYVGMADPPLSEFRPGQDSTGEVELYLRREDGSVNTERTISTVSLRQAGGHWMVTSARTDDIVVDNPKPLDTVRSPVVVDGRGRGYEGNIVVSVRDGGMGAGRSLAEAPTIGAGIEDLMPFQVELTLTGQPSQPVGSLLLMNDTGSFAAIPVRFGPTPTT